MFPIKGDQQLTGCLNVMIDFELNLCAMTTIWG